MHGQDLLPGRLAQLLEQLRRVPQAGRFDKQTIGPGLAQQAPQAHLERRTVDTAQAATGHLAQGDTVLVPGQQRRVQADLAELVDQHRPALMGRTLRQQVLDQAGLARAEGAGDDVGGDVVQHGWSARKEGD